MGSRHNSTGNTYTQSGREAPGAGGASQTLMDAISDEDTQEHQTGPDEVEDSYEEHVEGSEITDHQSKTISDRRTFLSGYLKKI